MLVALSRATICSRAVITERTILWPFTIKKKKKRRRACSSTQAVGYQKAQKNKRSPFTTLPMHQISLSNSIDQIYIYIYNYAFLFLFPYDDCNLGVLLRCWRSQLKLIISKWFHRLKKFAAEKQIGILNSSSMVLGNFPVPSQSVA